MTISSIVYLSFGLSIFFDLLLYGVRPLWRFRQSVSLLVLAATAFSATILFLWNPTLWTFAFLVAGVYRIFTTLRISEGRVHEVYLRTASFRSELVFICLQL